MSLINDALKRATKTKTPPPPSASAEAPAAAMEPVEGHRSVGLPSYFIPVLLIVFCGAFWFLIQGWEAKRQFGLYPRLITLQAREVPQEIPSAAGATTDAMPLGAEIDPESAIPENRNFSLNDQPVSRQETPIVTSPISRPATDPAYRLQGIFFRPSRPSAVVNSKTVYVGDLIAGGVVRAIDQQTVTIERNGTSTVLTLQ